MQTGTHWHTGAHTDRHRHAHRDTHTQRHTCACLHMNDDTYTYAYESINTFEHSAHNAMRHSCIVGVNWKSTALHKPCSSNKVN